MPKISESAASRVVTPNAVVRDTQLIDRRARHRDQGLVGGFECESRASQAHRQLTASGLFWQFIGRPSDVNASQR
jgi:hypothetical protein